MTPEGKVKQKIKKLLDARKPLLYYHMPVQAGYGCPSLDFVGWYLGKPFAIEAKRPGKHPTDRQEGTRDDMVAAGAVVFVVAGDASLLLLELWLSAVEGGE